MVKKISLVLALIFSLANGVARQTSAFRAGKASEARGNGGNEKR